MSRALVRVGLSFLLLTMAWTAAADDLRLPRKAVRSPEPRQLPRDVWPTVAKEQRRFNVAAASEGDDECSADGDSCGEDEMDVGDGNCLSGCFNPCMLNKVCTIAGGGCTTKTYGRCKNTQGSQPCTAC